MILFGRDIKIFQDGVAIAAAKSCEISKNVDTHEIATPSDTEWKRLKAERYEWSVQVSTLVTEFRTRFNLGQKVTLTMAVCDANGMTRDSLMGEAWLQKSEITAQLGNLVQGGFTFQGIGNLIPIFSEIEYIESTGTQWINTGIVQSSRNFELTLKFQWTGSTDSQFESFFAYMSGGGVTPRSGFHKYQSKWMFGTNVTNSTSINVDNDIHTVFITSNASTQKESLYIDETFIMEGNTTVDGIGANTIPFFLGARNRNNSTDNPCSARFFMLNYKWFNDAAHTTIYKEFDFVPVRDKHKGKMIDNISGQLFSNIGTGQFLLGPDKT